MAGFCFSKRPQTPHSPGAALLPRRSQPSDSWTSPVHPLLRCYWRLSPAETNQVGVSKAILRSRNTAPPPQRRRTPARPLPKPPLETGGTRGISDQGAATGRGAPWTKHSVGLPEWIPPLESTAAAPQAWNG